MQGIEFQIVNDSAEASKGLDELSASLNKLKSNLGGAGTSLNKAAAGITSIKNALNKMNTGNFESQLQRISKGLEALNTKTAGLKISSSIGNQLREIGSSLNAMPDTGYEKLNNLANGLKPLGELGRANLTSFINQLGKLPKVIEELKTANMDKFAQQMKTLAAAMKPFADEMQKVSTGFSAFPSRIQRLITSTERYNRTVQAATAGTTGWGRALKTVSFAAVFKSASSFLAKTINKASEYTEALNMFAVSMGSYGEEAYNYAQKVSAVMGIDPATWMENQGVFNSIITGFGVSGDKAAVMSKNLTQLGYDISSFYNTTVEDAMQKVQSGISGELEPLRRLGYDLSVARLQQEAYNLGIQKNVSEMTQAEKAQLRYHAMLTQVTQVQGDMARTLDQPANQLRVLKAQLEQASRAVGNLFIPILNKVLPVAIAVAQAIREIITAIGELFGIEMADNVEWDDGFDSAASLTGTIADGMDDAAGSAKKLKNYMMGFDELNVISPQDMSGSGSGMSGGSEFDIDPIDYDFLSEAVTERVDAIRAKLEPFVNWIEAHLSEIFTAVKVIGVTFAVWKISGAFVGGLSAAKKVIDGIKAGLNTAGQLAGWLTSRFTGMNVPLSASAAKIGKIASLAGVIAVIALRFADLYANSEKFRTGLVRAGEIVGTLFGGIKTIVGDVLENFKQLGAAVVDFLPESAKKNVLAFFEDMKGWLGKLDLDWKDMAITIAGIAALFVPGGKLVGAALLGFEGISAAIRALGGLSDEQFNGIMEAGKNAFSGIWEFAKNTLNGLIKFMSGVFIGDWRLAFDGIKTVASGVFDTIGTLAETLFGVNIANVVKDCFEQHIKPFFSFKTWSDLFVGVKTAIVEKIREAINGGITLFNRFIDWVNEKMRFEWPAIEIAGKTIVEAGSVQLFTIPKIPMMAEGGFPDTGELFIAREAGAEMVGSIGGKTAVANNDQIVAAVSGGVREANDEQNRLLREQNDLLRAILEKNTGVVLDGKTLLKSTEKAARQRGTVIMAGGVTG